MLCLVITNKHITYIIIYYVRSYITFNILFFSRMVKRMVVQNTHTHIHTHSLSLSLSLLEPMSSYLGGHVL